MDYCLVVGLDGSSVVKDHDFSLKVKNRLRLCILIYQNHTLSEVVTFELLLFNKRLDAEANCLTRVRNLNLYPLMMNSTDLNWFENTGLVWAKLQIHTWSDSTSKERASNNDTYTSYHVNAIDKEFNRICGLSKLSTSVDSAFD